MAVGRDRWLWNHTASLIAWLVTVQTGKAHDAAQFHPYEKRPSGMTTRNPIRAENIEDLKVFVNMGRSRG